MMEKLPRCLICKKEKAIKHSLYGWLPGKNCQKKQKEITKPKVSTEITSDQIKEDRKIFKKDLTQPFRGGELSKEYIEAYPDRVKQMIKEKHITNEEVEKSKYIWDLEYYKRE